MPNYCPDCGTNVREFVGRFCPSCGRRLPTGDVQVYHNLAESPPEDRALFEQACVRDPGLCTETDS
jgi:predicted amidophosphoribosyltransferase